MHISVVYIRYDALVGAYCSRTRGHRRVTKRIGRSVAVFECLAGEECWPSGAHTRLGVCTLLYMLISSSSRGAAPRHLREEESRHTLY
uniref:Uncharacterized protein n=1 Tax=Trichogramma kaykai TaxID=54128 RepID=A0ABD2XCA5_9HYME